MPENSDNIRYFCPEHAPKPIRYEGPLQDLVGGWVKKAFTDPAVPGIREHMWVKVVSVSGKSVVGFLDNDPFHVKNIKRLAPVILERGDIEQVVPLNSPKKAS